MKYLDERIITTLNGLTIAQDGLYRYDVAINDEWESPAFTGNCFIAKGATSKTIDITDIVRNFYDFSYPYDDTDFQAEWQVKIYTDDTNTVFSDSIGIFPIYRYPNRKSRLETPLSNNEVDWVQPALQGFDSEHKGEFLPHIPFVYSDKVDYNIAINCGNVTITPYLYSGVKKTLQQSDFGIYNTQYKLSELWTGDEVETLDWKWNTVGENTDVANPDAGELSIKSLMPLQYAYYTYWTPKSVHIRNDDTKDTIIPEFPYVKDISIYNDSALDLYLYGENEDNYVNMYPNTQNESEKITAHIFIDEAFENYVSDIESGTVGQPVDDYWFIDEHCTNLQVVLMTADGEEYKTVDLTSTESINVFTDEEVKRMSLYNTTPGIETTYIGDLTLSPDVYANDAGREIVFQFVLGGTEGIKIYPIEVHYNIDVTFRTYRQLNAPLDQENIVIENEGVDNLTTSDWISFAWNKQDIEVVYGEQDLNSLIAGKQIVSKFPNPTWSYAIVDNKGKVYSGTTFTTTNAFPLIEGDFDLYIFATKNDQYEVTKITTKDFGLAKSFALYMMTNNTTVLLTGWIAVLNTSDKYKQYVASKNTFEVAKVDACPSRYYLQWRDRYGSMQMQSFDNFYRYNETFTSSTSEENKTTVSIESFWSAYKEIPLDELPYYESLFVSPWIKLYDTKEDQIYDVVLNNKEYVYSGVSTDNSYKLDIRVSNKNNQNIVY